MCSKKPFRSESGTQMVEYAIGVALLIGVFIVAGQLLTTAGSTRASRSTGVENRFVPCGGSNPIPAADCF